MSSILVDSAAAPATVENLQQILAGKYFFLATLTVLLYDHLLTLPEEVSTVWKKKKTYVLCLFLLIRYYAPIAVSIVAVGFFSTAMTRERCKNWMLFLPLGITMPLMLFPGILMLVRVYALYNRNKIILGLLSTILLAQTITGIWQYTLPGGTPITLSFATVRANSLHLSPAEKDRSGVNRICVHGARLRLPYFPPHHRAHGLHALEAPA